MIYVKIIFFWMISICAIAQTIDQYKTTTATGSVNVYTIPNSDFGAYRTNEKWLIDFTGVTTNSGAATLNRFSLGAKAIKMPDGTDVTSGILTGRVQLSYNGTYFYLVGGAGSSGSVTNVSATSPLFVTSPTTTPNITIQQATTSQNGYLTNTDWNTFNGKQDAITFGTGVQTALGVNIGSAGAPVLFNGATGTPSSLVGTNITGTASGLTAGNVTTNANLTGPITSVGNATSIASQTGTGTTFVMQASPVFTGTPTLGTLGYSDTGILISLQSSTNSYNQFIIQNTNSGATASSSLIVSNDIGTATTHYGEFTMNSSGFIGSGSFNIANAVQLDAVSDDLVIGTLANKSIHFVTNNSTTDAITISGVGAYTFNGTTTAIHKELFPTLNTSITNGAGLYLQNPTAATVSQNQNTPSIAIEGTAWKTDATAASRTFLFRIYGTGLIGTSAPDGVFVIGKSIAGGGEVRILGSNASNIMLGSNAGVNGYTGTYALVAIGVGAAQNNTAINNTAIGFNALNAGTSGANNTAIGFSAITYGNFSNNVAVGMQAMQTASASQVTAIGASALISGAGVNSSALGFQAGYYATGSNLVAIGTNALLRGGVGNNNIGIGSSALINVASEVTSTTSLVGGSSYTNGIYNGVQLSLSSGDGMIVYPTANITVSGNAVTVVTIVTGGYGTTANNTILTCAAALIGGTGSGWSVSGVKSSGASNIGIGTSSGSGLTSATNCVYIGTSVSAQNATANGQLAIQNIIFGTGNTATGTTLSTGKIGIGVVSPGGTFSVTSTGAYPTIQTIGQGTGTNYSIRAFQSDGTTEIFSLKDNGDFKVGLSGSKSGFYGTDAIVKPSGNLLTAISNLGLVTSPTIAVTDVANLLDGTYTPSLTNVTNITASTAYVTGYYRIGNSVTVFGKIDVNPTLGASTATEIAISLPVASNLANEQDLGGVAISDSLASETARIKGDASNDRASVVFKSISISNDSYSFEFSYQVK